VAALSFEIVEGRGSGRMIPVDGTFEIGREQASAQIVLEDELVSRRHLRVTPVDGTAVVEDLGSRNGTFVNGNEIHSPARLAPGDQVLIGATVLELRSSVQIAREPSRVVRMPPGLAVPPRPPNYVPAGIPIDPKLDERAHVLDPLLDRRTKARARLAPVAVALLAVFVVIIFLALR
jgi:pSer/pThr/pTyr-binding forkhead associated (FHA) protein